MSTAEEYKVEKPDEILVENIKIEPKPEVEMKFKEELNLKMKEKEKDIESGIVYEMAFDGNDAEAEMIEKSTDLSFLGDSTNPFDNEVPCCTTGKKTNRRVFLAKTY